MKDDMKKKPDLALLIGGGAKAPMGEEPSDRRSLAEKAFAKAVRRGDGIADALEELLDVIDGGDEEEMDEEMDPMAGEEPMDGGF